MEPILWVLTWFLGGHCKSFFRIAFKFYRFELLPSHNIPLVFGFLLWQQISKYIDKHYKNFQNFLNFHLIMCRSVSVVVLVGQVILSVFIIRLFFLHLYLCSHHTSSNYELVVLEKSTSCFNHPSGWGCSWAMVDLLGHLGGDLSLCGWIYSRIVFCFMLSKHPLPLTKIYNRLSNCPRTWLSNQSIL